MRSGTNLPRVGGYNRAVILEGIRRSEGVSRVELASLTGLTSQTVSNIVRKLLDEDLVIESGRSPSAGGKPRTTLTLNPSANYSIGVHLDPDATVTVLVDLSGKILARVRRRTQSAVRPETALRRLSDTVEKVISQAGIDRSRLLGVGVASPGPIDLTRGLVVEPPNLAGWHEVPLVTSLGELTGLPVVMDNDSTAAAVGERWAGGPARAGSFAFVYLGAGIGGGIVFRDGVHRGDTGNAGEFGHMAVVPDGRECFCGNRGCVEAHCSPRAIIADLFDRHGNQVAANLGITGEKSRTRAEYTALCLAASQGQPEALDVIQTAARLLGQAAVSLVNLLDVTRVVLGGQSLTYVDDIICTEVERQVNSLTIARWVRKVTVERSVIGEDAGAVGAASLVLHGNYAPGWTQLLASGG